MRVLLFSSYFPPDEHVGAVRWGRLARSLRRRGHEICVIADDNGTPQKALTCCDDIRRVDRAASLADRLLTAVSAAKKGSGLEVRRQRYVAQEGGGSGAADGGILRFYVRGMSALGKVARFPSSYWWSAGGMITAGLRLAAEWRPDVMVATHPFPGCLKAANAVSARTGIPWIADMRDGWSSYYASEYRPGSALHRGIAALERHYLARAATVVTVNAQMAATLQARGDRIAIIPTSYDPDEACAPIRSNSGEDPAAVLAFAGTVLPEHYCDAFMAGLSACARTLDSAKVVVNYYGGDFLRLQSMGMAAGIPGDWLADHGYVPKNRLREELRNADLLVVFGFRGQYGATITTAKVFDYIEAGRPILAVASPDSALAAVVSTTGVGVVAPDPRAVEEVVAACARDRATFLAKMLAQRREEALRQYSADETARRYEALLASVLANAHGRGGERRSG